MVYLIAFYDSSTYLIDFFTSLVGSSILLFQFECLIVIRLLSNSKFVLSFYIEYLCMCLYTTRKMRITYSRNPYVMLNILM